MKKNIALFLIIPCVLLSASGCSVFRLAGGESSQAEAGNPLQTIEDALEAAAEEVDVSVATPAPTEVAVTEVPATEAPEKVPVVTVTMEPEEQEDEIRVPDVVGRPGDEAESVITAMGLNVIMSEKESNNVEPGFVISQAPAADKKVKAGEYITIYVAKEPEEKETAKEEKKEEETKQEDNKTYLYCTASDYLTLRDIASRSGRELARISYNEKLEFLGMEGEFTFVSYNGQNGYVLTEFLSSAPDAAKNYGSGSKKPDSSSSLILYCCASEYATLRSSASRSADALAHINSREAAAFISSVGEFYYVDYNGTKGYVLQDFFSFDPNAPLNYADR